MMKLIFPNGNELVIEDWKFKMWLEIMMQYDALIADEAREDLFNNASLGGLVKAFKEGAKEYELSEDESNLLMSLIGMRKVTY